MPATPTTSSHKGRAMKTQPEPYVAANPRAPGLAANLGEEGQQSTSCQERRRRGRAARQDAPRSGHATWKPPANRPDPIELLEAQAKTRDRDLAPIRYARMVPSPFAFMRGAAMVMAYDLSGTPRTGIRAQLCGDAHLLNFGAYASPERTLLFDVNDFDETLPGPWEWDLKRLAASLVVAGRENGFDAAACRQAARSAVASYRERMAEFSEMGELEAWYSRVRADEIFGLIADSKSMKKGYEIHKEGPWARQPADAIQVDQGRRWSPEVRGRPSPSDPCRRGRDQGTN